MKSKVLTIILCVVSGINFVALYAQNPKSQHDRKFFTACPGSPTVADIDGNIYNTALIGEQCWIKENLKTTKYSNGTSIDYPGTNNGAWSSNTDGAYAWYSNSISWKDSYGAYYNWYAVNNANGLCPSGWHVPDDEEWKILEGTVDSYYGVGDPIWDQTAWRGYDAGKNLKSTIGWSINTGSDFYDFTAIPAGYRHTDGSYIALNTYAFFWSSSENYPSVAWSRHLAYNNDGVRRLFNPETFGFSVRCVKNPESGSCLPPSNLILEDVSCNSSTIAWTPNANEDSWDLKYGPTGFDPQSEGTAVEGITENPVLIEGLAPGESYDVYVRAVCSDDEKSDWSLPLNLETHSLQMISLPAGWSGLSSFLVPNTGALEVLFENFIEQIIIVQNETGIFWPNGNVNTLGEWNSMEGYQIKVSSAINFNLAGYPVSNNTIQLQTGWNLIPVLSDSPVNPEILFDGTNVILVRDAVGITLFWPALDINTIGFLTPGKSYFVMMGSPDEITFP
ncbi:MAG: fibronectin type III domain-containing protein [Bacteroidales bacterium]|nr:fibronectin type III domain-containing protein [Bacteroidales bacterium]